VTVHLDTSILVDALSDRTSVRRLAAVAERGDRMQITSLVLFEWLRGPRSPEEVALCEALFPPESIVPFGETEARLAALLYRSLPRARTRQVDLAIAACALERGAAMWTLNPGAFHDVPQLKIYQPVF
jgi:predicted nucleic acid-binding protein